MKNHNPMLWGIASIVIGLLMMLYPVDAIELMIRIIGIILLLIGAIQLLNFILIRKKNNMPWSSIPLGGVLGLVLGLMLCTSPALFISFFMILVGVVIIFLGISQIVNLSYLRRAGANVRAIFYLFPILMCISGIVFFIFPIETTAWLTIFAGAWVLAYGISEIAGSLLIKNNDTTK